MIDKMCPDLTKNAAPIMLALVVTIGFFYFIYRLSMPTEIPKENMAQLNILLGGVGVVWAKCIGFFYDSSASSKDKDATISEIAKTPAIPVIPTDSVTPINIPNADNVTVRTEKGNVNVNKKGKP